MLLLLAAVLAIAVGATALAGAWERPERTASVATDAAMPDRPEPRVQIPHPAPVAVTAAQAPQPAPRKPQPAPAKAKPKQADPAQVKVAVAPPPASGKPSPNTGTGNPVEFTVVLETHFKNIGTSAVSSGHVSVPLFSVMQSRSQVILTETITPTPSEIVVDGLGNRTGAFDLAGIPPGETLVVSQRYRLRIWGSGGLGTSGPTKPQHLAAATKIEAAAPEIIALAQSLTGGKDTVLAKIDSIFDYTHNAIRYDANSPARNQGALAALSNGAGVCEEYASLFVALCRATGIPARVCNGFGRDFATAGAAWRDGANIRGYRHAWAEAWIPDYGWATFDPTFDKASVSGIATRAIGSGTLILDNYGDKSILGKYAGGKLEITRKQWLNW